MTTRQKDQAKEILTRMASIVKNERLRRGFYFKLPKRLQKPDEGKICRGGYACAIGSFMLAARVEPIWNQELWDRNGGDWILPDEAVNNPTSFLYDEGSKAQRAALASLNAVAQDWLDRPEIQKRLRHSTSHFDEPIERLFEGAYGTRGFGRKEMLLVISQAKRRITQDKVRV